jgi:hypothetical protein
MDKRTAIKVGVAILSVITHIGSIAWSIRETSGIEWQYIALGAFVVFVVFMGWLYYDLYKENQQLKNKETPATSISSHGQRGGQTAQNIFNIGQDQTRLITIGNALAEYIKRGQALFKQGKEQTTADTKYDWAQRWNNWIKDTADYIRNNLSEAAVVSFGDRTSMLPFSYRKDLGNDHDLQLRILDRLLHNLHNILRSIQA